MGESRTFLFKLDRLDLGATIPFSDNLVPIRWPKANFFFALPHGKCHLFEALSVTYSYQVPVYDVPLSGRRHG